MSRRGRLELWEKEGTWYGGGSSDQLCCLRAHQLGSRERLWSLVWRRLLRLQGAIPPGEVRFPPYVLTRWWGFRITRPCQSASILMVFLCLFLSDSVVVVITGKRSLSVSSRSTRLSLLASSSSCGMYYV